MGAAGEGERERGPGSGVESGLLVGHFFGDGGRVHGAGGEGLLHVFGVQRVRGGGWGDVGGFDAEHGEGLAAAAGGVGVGEGGQAGLLGGEERTGSAGVVG